MLDSATRQDILDAIASAAAILDPEGRVLAVNRAWMRFAERNGGDAEGYYLGRSYLGACTGAQGENSAEAAMVAEGLRSVLDGAEMFRCEYPCHSPTERRWFEVVVSAMPTAEGRLVLVMHHDISRRRREQDDVARSQDDSEALAALVASSTYAIISYDLDGIVRTWNPAAEALYGYAPDEIIGRSMEALYPEDWPVRITEYRDRTIADGRMRLEVVRRTKSGVLRDVSVNGAPVRSPDGDVVAVLNIHRDITDEKRAREHLAFVTRELGHRSKNLLAVVQSIQRQTARRAASLDEFGRSFESRLASLAASIDLLASQDWGRVWMDRLASSQLAVFAGPDSRQVSVDGPRVMLDADAVEAVGMSLHELGTNAVKHGALGPAGGAIRLSWSFEGGAEAPELVVRWEERSPGVTGPPRRTGFGHAVTTLLIEQKLQARVSLDFAPGQLVWSAAIPRRRFSL